MLLFVLCFKLDEEKEKNLKRKTSENFVFISCLFVVCLKYVQWIKF